MYNDTDKALEDAIQDCKKKLALFNQSQGKPFTEFSRKQPDTLTEILNRLDEKIKMVFKADNAAEEALPILKNEFSKMRPINDDINGKRKLRDNLRDKMDKSVKNAEKLQSKLEQLKMKAPQSPEVAKTQSLYNIACRQRETDITNYKEKETQIKTEEVEYKKQLFKTIMNGFGLYSVAKGQSCVSMVQIGQSINSIGQAISPYYDPGIETLRTKLQGLQSMEAE